jgi:hypothetical protein
MAIKRRTPATQPDPEAIEAFGAAAEAPTVAVPTRAAERVPGVVADDEHKIPKTAPRTLLIRYPSTELPLELAAVAALEDRSQHATALRALRRGLAILRAEAEEKPR